MLVPGAQPNDLIFLYTTKCQHDKSSYHLSSHKVITVLLTIPHAVPLIPMTHLFHG